MVSYFCDFVVKWESAYSSNLKSVESSSILYIAYEAVGPCVFPHVYFLVFRFLNITISAEVVIPGDKIYPSIIFLDILPI